METFVFMKYFCNDNISNIPKSWMNKKLVYNQITKVCFCFIDTRKHPQL